MDSEALVLLYKEGDKSFSRDRIFSFKVLFCFFMSNLPKAIQREIALFKDALELDGSSIPEAGKAAFCKERNKLKPTVFVALSDIVLGKFYKSDDVHCWHSYRIIGVDGSTAELPDSERLILNNVFSSNEMMVKPSLWGG